MPASHSRRDFVAASLGALVTLTVRPLRADPSPHPTPRPGITADKVLRREQLAESPDAVAVFDMVREIPEVVDGIRCNCGCASSPGYYSLLTCFEGKDAMAQHCQVCQGQGRLAHRLHKAGKSLDEIRKGIDARYG